MADPCIDWPTLLREFRASNGLKQAAAADLLGVSQATISRWECGAIEPTTAMRNRLFRALRRTRRSLAMRNWLRAFRRMPCPGSVTTDDGRLLASTGVVANTLGFRREEVEGKRLDEVFTGEILDIGASVREAGVFGGEVANIEACLQLEFDPHFRRCDALNVHIVGWPHFTDDGRVLLVCQGAILPGDQARDVRERLGGTRFDVAA